MSYQRERGECIAQLTKHGLPYPVIETLLRCATSINRYAELACSSEAADRDRIPCPAMSRPALLRAQRGLSFYAARFPCLCDVSNGGHTWIPRITLRDCRVKQRAFKAVPDCWRILTEGDPRGYTLRVIPPSYTERNVGRDRFNLEAIGVPARESRLRF